MSRGKVGVVAIIMVMVLVVLSGIVWLFGSSNPYTPAGYAGYVTQGAVFGQTKYVGLQKGPVSSGRRWLYRVANVSITPYTFSEDFSGTESVLAKDDLNIAFRVHLVFKIKEAKIKEFMEDYSYLEKGVSSDDLVRVAYGNYVKEPLRTFARDEVQKHKGLEVKDNITVIGQAVEDRIKKITGTTPFEVSSVVVGNIQYPNEVITAVSKKLAATQDLERKQTEIDIEEKERQKKVVQARGIAEAMEIIRGQLTSQYLQHEAIEAQKSMVNSSNNTVVYIPVGNMGVPLTGTFNVTRPASITNDSSSTGKN